MVLRIGHRGAAGHAPENTLKSISTAIALGADLIEVDVQRTSDGSLVIIHDKRVDRTTDGTGYVSSITLDDIRKLRTADGQQIPTLKEVLALAHGRAGLILEIISPGIGEQVCAEVREFGFTDPIIYASFLHAELLTVRLAEPLAETLALLEGIPIVPTTFAIDAKASVVGLAIDSITAPFINALHDAGLRVFIYTVNDARDIQWVKSLKANGIISDFPERI